MSKEELQAEDLADESEEVISEEEYKRELKPTLSDILLTPEEKLARKEYRLTASKCCVNEAWRMYRRVVGDDNAIEPVHLTTSETSSDVMITRMGVLYDPTAGLRMRFLKKKFAYLLSGFRAIKQAAYKPFIRCQKPQRVDVEGQGRAMPAVAKAFHREVYVTYTHPSTFACKEKWTKIFNRNFISVEDMQRDLEEKETQTWQLELSVEKFDIEDIPLDKDGNPVGRSVGICEWCGHSILPIPSEHTLSVEWNLDALYCCDRYRQFIEETKRATQAIEAECDKTNFLIDIGSKTKKKGIKSKSSRSQSQLKLAVSKDKMLKILEDKYMEAIEEPTHDKGVDTFDLPWDPMETRALVAERQRKAQAVRDQQEDADQTTEQTMEQNQLQEEGSDSEQGRLKTSLKNIDILLELEEIYSHRTSISSAIRKSLFQMSQDKPQ